MLILGIIFLVLWGYCHCNSIPTSQRNGKPGVYMLGIVFMFIGAGFLVMWGIQ